MQNFEYNFNVNGNYSSAINNMTRATGDFTAQVSGSLDVIDKLAGSFAKFDLASSGIQKLAGVFNSIGQGAVVLDSQMHDLSAVAGVTGERLKTIEGYARSSAKAFGTDAGVAVQGYKLLLSQLSPELGKYPSALKAMGDAIQTTSKLMGNDGTAAAEVLTTAMNQYGVSLADPMEASRKMAEMMNTMAAAGQAGSAELPAIKAALEQCGMAAKAANVSFEETNAAIQVLDKAGKKGSEGGVALRNTLSILSQGRFLPKDTREELERAGIDILALGDKSKSLKDRLELLKPVLNDSALFSKLFGMENANAARALVQGTEQLGQFTEAVTGTNSAEEQAATVMESTAEEQSSIVKEKTAEKPLFIKWPISTFQTLDARKERLNSLPDIYFQELFTKVCKKSKDEEHEHKKTYRNEAFSYPSTWQPQSAERNRESRHATPFVEPSHKNDNVLPCLSQEYVLEKTLRDAPEESASASYYGDEFVCCETAENEASEDLTTKIYEILGLER